MTKDTNENNTQSSSFRDQILRDLEELKLKRLADQAIKGQTEQPNQVKVDQQIEFPAEPVSQRETIPVGEMTYPETYLAEEGQENLEEEVEEIIPSEPVVETEDLVVEKEEVPTSAPVTQDTVERNLEELRRLVAANTTGFENEPSPVATPETEVEPSLEETFVDFPVEDVSAVTGDTEIISLEDTLLASKINETPAEKSEEPVVATALPSRKNLSNKSSLQRRKKQDKAAKRIVSVIMSLILLVVVVTGIAGYMWIKSSLEPVNAKATEAVQVEIPEGSSTLEIGKILVDNQLVKNATVFNYYSKIKSYNNFQSGYYNLKQSMSVDDIAKALQESGTPTPQKEPAGKILIVEGYTLTQISQAITNNTKTEDKNDKTPFTSEEFMATVTNPDFINRMVAAYPQLFASLPAADSGVIYQLEGYLFPAVYEYTEETTMEELVEQMIAAMDARLQPYYETIAAKNLTVNEVLTLASLVEKEGSTDEDRRNIASVFFNRLNNEMPLQSNIAILYAQGKLGQETTLAEDAGIDTNIDSPYNIYWRAGLMPGPVDSPSVSAIEAVINANTTDYLYFVADVTTGTVYYARTIEEHDQNVAKYVNAHLE
ncbi:endolytic transglycosylase MltG [Streptococcus suis]|uniref:endolytic transglycosylase MltG n=1 Tax=Streptococcus suis TaxID=1307 RepID=UPI000CF703CC|nr:endolytic transglycosylase MltG [Streptococcus suis]